jgi:hypothetical protein
MRLSLELEVQLRQRMLKLSEVPVSTTMRYAHLAPGAFTEADLAAVGVDLTAPGGKVIAFAPGTQSDKLGTLGHGAAKEAKSEAS